MRLARANDRGAVPAKGHFRMGRFPRVEALMVAIAVLLLLGPWVGEVRAQTFVDVDQTDWFYSPVETLAARGAVAPFSDGSFRPYEPVTRAEFASMIAMLLDLTPASSGVFADVTSENPFAGAVGALYEAGIVAGRAGGGFAPDADLSRQQAATLVMRAYSYRSQADSETTGATGGIFTDEDQIALWLQGFKDRAAIAPDHRAAVANAYHLAVISGFDDARFYPFLSLTRAQAAGVLCAALVAAPAVRSAAAPPVPAEPGYPTAEEGSRGPLVGWMERRLAVLSYDPGPVDGLFDSRTAEAVMAFQKVEGLERTGAASIGTWISLLTADRPAARKSVGGDRVEIDLTRQVLFVIADGTVARTIPIASGRQGWRTPTGTFAVERKLPYWRQSSLGMLYKPAYFRGGYAIHGSYSVPPYPASHGCVRVSVPTMDVLYPLLVSGMRVDVYY